jgi:hypothetical protein
MEDERQTIPSGLEHLEMLQMASAVVLAESRAHFEEFKTNRAIIGTALSALYQTGTCHRECQGGDHLLQRLCGRAYNLGYAANSLVELGLYDEALNLICSLAEMTNLVMLLALDSPKIEEWRKADRRTRLNEFRPAKVRRMLATRGHMCIDDKTYAELSEGYTHITPQTQPNFHSGKALVGGKYEKDGAASCYGKLSYTVMMLAMFLCKFFKFDDLFGEMAGLLRRDGPALIDD